MSLSASTDYPVPPIRSKRDSGERGRKLVGLVETVCYAENDVYSEAGYSPCRRYRYTLIRRFGKKSATKKERIAFIGLNPSTATERVNDPTVRRCIGYAQQWGYREFIMLNAFGLRSTDPKGLLKVDDPNGLGNDEAIQTWVKKSSVVVCCWGVHARLNDRHQELVHYLYQWGIRPQCLGVTQAGFPRHPLYLRKDAMLVDLPG
jgi:hypothetical protein